MAAQFRQIVLTTSIGLLLILTITTSLVQATNTVQREVVPVNYVTNDADTSTIMDSAENEFSNNINFLEQFSIDPAYPEKLKRAAYGLLRLSVRKPYHKQESQLTFAPKMSNFIPVRGRRQAFHKIRIY